MERPIGYSQSVELVVPTGFSGNQINFPDIPLLRSDLEQDVIIRGMKVYPSQVVPTCPSGNAAATMAQIQATFLTLYAYGYERFQRISLTRLVQVTSNAHFATDLFYQRDEYLIDNLKVDWTKSYITVPAGYGTVSAPFSILFEFDYEILPVGAIQAYVANKLRAESAGIIKN